MKRLRLLFIPLLCATVFITACSDDPAATNNENNQTPNTHPTLDDFIAKVVTARATGLCHTAFECPETTSPEQVALLGRLGDIPTCIQHFEYQIAQSTFPDIQASVAADRTLFNASLANDCITRLNADAQTCAPNPTITEQACDAVFTATQSPGQPCAAPTECLNSTCNTSMSGNSCVGTCIPNPPTPTIATQGQPCAEAICEPHLLCSYTLLTADNEPTCLTPTIATKGQRCTNPDTICQFPLLCDFIDETCIDPPTYATLDQPCHPPSNTYCRAGLTCAPTTQTCLPLQPQGQPCQWTAECKTGLYCDTTCLPLKNLDEPCDNTHESTQCTTGLRCTPNPQTQHPTCQDPHQSREACTL